MTVNAARTPDPPGGAALTAYIAVNAARTPDPLWRAALTGAPRTPLNARRWRSPGLPPPLTRRAISRPAAPPPRRCPSCMVFASQAMQSWTDTSVVRRGAVDIPLVRYECEAPVRSVLMCHGIFSDKTEDGRYTRLAERLLRHRCSSWQFDFPGHGDSPEPPEAFTVGGALADFLIAAQAHRDAFPEAPRAVIASSFGGSVVLLAALAGHLAELGYDKLALLNPVTDYRSSFLEPFGEQLQEIFTPDALAAIRRNGAAEVKPGFVLGLAALVEFELLDPALGLRCIDLPTLILHGDRDTAVSHDLVRRDSAASASATFVTIPNASHSFVEPESERRSFDLLEGFLLSDV